VARLFRGEDGLKAFALLHASPAEVQGLFADDPESLRDYLARAAGDRGLLERFGGRQAFQELLERILPPGQRGGIQLPAERQTPRWLHLLGSKGLTTAQAILPLSLFLVLVILVVLRSRPRRSDELVLGILFSLAGTWRAGSAGISIWKPTAA